MFSLLLYLHIISVVISLGPFFVLIPLLKKMGSSHDQQLAGQLDVFHYVVQLSKHAGHVLVTTGVLLMIVANYPWSTSWIIVTVAILLCALFFIARAFTPTIRKLRAPHTSRDLLIAKLRRAVYMYIFILLIMLWLMVAKPALW